MSFDVKKVRYISLIRLEGGESILNLPFTKLAVDPDLIAGFVTAVIIFAKTPIRTIRKAVYDILIEVGKTVLILLVVDPIPSEVPYRARMTRILDLVEAEHGEKLERFEGDVRRFREFSIKILNEFPYSIPNYDYVPYRKQDGDKIPFRVGNVDKLIENVEGFINGKRTVSEILDLINLPEEEVIALISILEKFKWIDFRRRLSDTDTLVQADCSEVVLTRLKVQYGKPLEELIASFSESKIIKDVIASLPYDQNALWFLLNKLVEIGCLTQ
ncbi:MAG: hypothetical protein ACTSV2_02395 [Candidatus Thorarchaeota archaeon]